MPARRALAVIALLVAAAGSAASTQAQRRWAPLAKDGVHDPASPALRQLQEPAAALAALPADSAGNLVDWVAALERGTIRPRTNVRPETAVRVLESDVIVSRYRSMQAVRFPHRQHTLWLDCSNCHDALFKPVRGGNRFSMQAILDGEQCGVCHGAVAFPLTECNRCHSVPNAELRRLEGAGAARR